MNRYDWGYGFGFGQRFSARRGGRGYDAGFGRGGGFRGGGYGADFGDRPRGARPGVYGEDYSTFGGYPGANQQGMYYGGGQMQRPAPGYDRGFGRSPGRGYDRGFAPAGRPGYDRGFGGRGMQGGRGYDREFAREPFVPEDAYRRHPEMDRPQRHESGRWPAEAHARSEQSVSDDDISQSVRENLERDSWIDAEQVQVSVSGGVVTLQGQVGDYLEARYAWDDAWDATGVHGVLNQLTVRLDEQDEAHGETLPQTGGGKTGS